MSHYPATPGAKERGGTSEEAARSVAQRVAHLHKQILSLLEVHGPMTADETAERLGESVLTIRPRFSELNRARLIFKTSERRKNRSGRSAVVWKLWPY